jgi:leucyl-tRNA---protein transferase
MSKAQIYRISGQMLDHYLSEGWYRGNGRLFTTDRIYYYEKYYQVYWLRYTLDTLVYSKTNEQIFRRGAQFEYDYAPLRTVTAEMNELYEKYKQNIQFETSDTISDFLSDHVANAASETFLFDTEIITIRHAGALIAAGVIDSGTHSMSGIMNIYDPAYKKYSLGKLLVMTKITLAQQRGMTYFYPGYIVPGVRHFDYKAFVGAPHIQVYERPPGRWVAYDLLL